MFAARIAPLLLMLFLVSQTRAQSQVLGGPAPSLAGGQWIKGEPVTRLEPGKVYIVSVWNIPSAERADVAATLIDIAKTDRTNINVLCVVAGPHDAAPVQALLAKAGDQPNVRIVADEPGTPPGESITAPWLEIAPGDVYPPTFIIDQSGLVAFTGDVLEVREVVGDVMHGKLTAETAAIEREEVAKEIVKVQAELDRKALRMQILGDNIAAANAVDALIANHPRLRSVLLPEKFYSLLRAERFDDAYGVADEAAQANRFSPMQLNEMAWFIVDEEWITRPDLDRALKMSERSVELSASRVGAFLDTLARVHFERGDLEKAIEFQTKALAVSTPRERAELESAMSRYRDALPK